MLRNQVREPLSNAGAVGSATSFLQDVQLLEVFFLLTGAAFQALLKSQAALPLPTGAPRLSDTKGKVIHSCLGTWAPTSAVDVIRDA